MPLTNDSSLLRKKISEYRFYVLKEQTQKMLNTEI